MNNESKVAMDDAYPKFKDADARYLANRKKIAEKYGPRDMWRLLDHWPLYAGIRNLGRFMEISDLVRESLKVPGHLAEFGTWRGATLMLMAKLLRLYDPHGPKTVHCFDTFEGLTEFHEKDGLAKNFQEYWKGSEEELRDMIDLYDFKDEIYIHKGKIEETLPALLAEHKALSFSFVLCDTDLYDSTRIILETLHERLVQGGMFVFDDWNINAYPGEGMAVNEFLKKFGARYTAHAVPHAIAPTLVLRKTAW